MQPEHAGIKKIGSSSLLACGRASSTVDGLCLHQNRLGGMGGWYINQNFEGLDLIGCAATGVDKEVRLEKGEGDQ
jgi:hypothetical protein